MMRRARGVSLIEVLVSMVILSLGVLAVVALQLVAKRNNADAAQRTIASQLAYDIVERMRANSTTAALAVYIQAGEIGGNNAALAAQACTSGAPCTAAQLVQHDLALWEQALLGAAEVVVTAGTPSNTGGLVNPTACITGPAGGGDGIYTVTIAWRGNIELANDAAVVCGEDPPESGSDLYSKTPQDNVYRRTVSMPVYITARQS